VESGTREISGTQLAAARRAVSVALVVDVASEEVHVARTLLPPQADLLRVLDVLGWPGADENPVALTREDQWVLEDVTFVTLILALGEGERIAYQALGRAGGVREVDPASLVALASLADLALWLRGDDAPGHAAGTAKLGTASPALGALADTMVLPVWMTDEHFVIEWVNPAFRELLGSAPQVLGTGILGWCDPADAPRVAQVLEAAGLEQRNFSLEAQIGPPGGPCTRLLIIAAPRLTAAGTLLGWTGICFDISGEAAVRARLEELIAPLTVTSARTAMLLQEMPGDIWTTDCDLVVTSGMGATSRDPQPGPPRIGRTVMDIIGTDDAAHPVIAAHRAALAGEQVRFHYATVGRELDARVRPLRDAAGEVVGCIGFGIDVTGAMRANRRSAQLARQLAFAQRIARIGSWEADLATGEGLWSDEAFRVLGLEPNEVTPSFDAFLEHVHPDDRDWIAAMHRDGVRTGQGYEATYRAVLPDGTIRQMRGVVEFDTDDSGKVTRIAGILQDITPPGGSTDR
jgi:PAS domain-containing protein